METDATADRHAWEQPGAFEVAPGIHRIPLPLPNDGLKAVNVYVIVDGDQLVCIDGGWSLAESRDLLERSLGEIGFGLDQVREFLCTHHHRDHYTQAVAVRRTHGTKVSLGDGEQGSFAMMRTLPVDDHPDVGRLLAAGATELASMLATFHDGAEMRDLTDYEDPDRWLPDGVDLPLRTRTLRVIATPGHTRGHVVFHDPAHGMLFAGDHVLPHITPSIGVELNRPPSPLRDYLASLELVRAMPDAQLLPAHGPVTTSVHERIDELLHHHVERLDETAAALDQGASSGFEVARILGWTRRRRSFDDMDFFNQLLAVQETMAHLYVLDERGLVHSQRDDAGVVRFARR